MILYDVVAKLAERRRALRFLVTRFTQMDSLIRISAIVNKVSCANPGICLDGIKNQLAEMPEYEFDIAVLPKLALCSPSCGNLFSSPMLLSECENALDSLRELTKGRNAFVIAGLAASDKGKPVSAMAVLYRGELAALVPTLGNAAPLANSGFSEDYLPPHTIFECGTLRFCVLGCHLDDMAAECAEAARTGCDLIIIPSYEPVYAGYMQNIFAEAKALSRSLGIGIMIVNGGAGDTSHPYAYRGFAAVFECGTMLASQEENGDSFHFTVDIDADIIHAMKKSKAYVQPKLTVRPQDAKPGLFRPISQNPFLPEENKEAYLDELFLLQARSLASRMENTGFKKLVLGVSGGIDSTSALLVSTGAIDMLGLPRENIIGITMPGFGTSGQTYQNAIKLMEALKISRREISIKDAVERHFKDIGHSGAKDITYENAQARERTQILLDVANMESAIVVGSGDLSEAALGFCTFGGDHIAGYNVNSCVTKTVLRESLARLATQHKFASVAEALRDVLDTPVSPELLPPSKSGAIEQKTEEILGPYILHDFFLYHFVKYGFSPAKINFYAREAFGGEMDDDFILDKLGLFFKRFYAAQFKRSCAPDAASITEVNLCGVNFYIPSDHRPEGGSDPWQQLQQLLKD